MFKYVIPYDANYLQRSPYPDPSKYEILLPLTVEIPASLSCFQHASRIPPPKQFTMRIPRNLLSVPLFSMLNLALKVTCYCMAKGLPNWLHSIFDRERTVLINQVLNVTCGIPQGSVLGPTLFALACTPMTCWLQFLPGRATQQSFIRGGSAPRSKPLPFHIPFLREKVPLSYTLRTIVYSFHIPTERVLLKFSFEKALKILRWFSR